MATLYVTEIDHLAYDASAAVVLSGQMPPVVEQAIAITGASAQSNAFNTNARFIMVHNDVACCLAFGADPTAQLGFHRLAANERLFYGVKPGQKVAVIASA